MKNYKRFLAAVIALTLLLGILPAGALAAAPEAPANVTAVPGDRVINLLWDDTAGAESYNIYRDGAKINTSPQLTAGYIDSTAKNDIEYSYTVKAVNVDAESAASTAVLAKPNGTSSTTVILNSDTNYDMSTAGIEPMGVQFTIGTANGNIPVATNSYTLSVFANDVDLEQGETDIVYLHNVADGADHTNDYVAGTLSGMDSQDNTTIINIPIDKLVTGNTYQFYIDVTDSGNLGGGWNVTIKKAYLLTDGGDSSAAVSVGMALTDPDAVAGTVNLTGLTVGESYQLEYKFVNRDTGIQHASGTDTITNADAASRQLTKALISQEEFVENTNYGLDVVLLNGTGDLVIAAGSISALYGAEPTKLPPQIIIVKPEIIVDDVVEGTEDDELIADDEAAEEEIIDDAADEEEVPHTSDKTVSYTFLMAVMPAAAAVAAKKLAVK